MASPSPSSSIAGYRLLFIGTKQLTSIPGSASVTVFLPLSISVVTRQESFEPGTNLLYQPALAAAPLAQSCLHHCAGDAMPTQAALLPRSSKTSPEFAHRLCLERAPGKEQGGNSSASPCRGNPGATCISKTEEKGQEELGGTVADGTPPAASGIGGLAAARALRLQVLKIHPLAYDYQPPEDAIFPFKAGNPQVVPS